MVTVSQVEVSSSVQVTGYDSNVTHDMLMFYFENKRSGGGEIVHIKTENRRSIVQFRYAEGMSVAQISFVATNLALSFSNQLRLNLNYTTTETRLQ